MARPIQLSCGFLLALTAGVALADDTVGSTPPVVIDGPLAYQAQGTLVMNETGTDGFNAATPLVPVTVFTIDSFHWDFDLWYVVDGWEFRPGGGDEGAAATRIGIRGEHTRPPAHDPHGEPPLTLGAVLGGEALAGGARAADIRFGSGANLSVSATEMHGHHPDWYGVAANVRAYDPVIFPFDPADPAERRHLRGVYEVQARHADETLTPPWNDDGTLAVPEDTVASFDPADGVLRIRPGRVSVLDTQGGRTGGIAPEFADDPLVGVQPVPIEMRYAGFDPERNAHLFRGGRLLIEGRDGSAVALGGEVGELAITTTLPGDELGAYAPFDRLWVVDADDPDVRPSAWANAFVREGWMGEGQRLYPVLSLTTLDGDLVAATDGFRRRAEVPASVALTIAVPAPCAADLDGDGELTIFDFLTFQNLFDAGDPAADFDGDGELTIFDFLAFQNAFDAGC